VQLDGVPGTALGTAQRAELTPATSPPIPVSLRTVTQRPEADDGDDGVSPTVRRGLQYLAPITAVSPAFGYERAHRAGVIANRPEPLPMKGGPDHVEY
jgi:hypothetical protein